MLPGCAGSLSSGCVGPAGLLCQSAWLWCWIQILMHFCIVMHFCIIDVSIWFGSLCSVNLLLNPCSGFCPIRKSRYGLWIVNSCVDMHQEVVSQNGIGQCVNDIESVMHECMASGQFWFDTSDWYSISFLPRDVVPSNGRSPQDLSISWKSLRLWDLSRNTSDVI